MHWETLSKRGRLLCFPPDGKDNLPLVHVRHFSPLPRFQSCRILLFNMAGTCVSKHLQIYVASAYNVMVLPDFGCCTVHCDVTTVLKKFNVFYSEKCRVGCMDLLR